jgi:uncharacterized protein YggE
MSKKEKALCTGTMTVSGTGEIKVQPDTAWIHLGISTRGKSAQQAVGENAERLTAVTTRIAQLGIAEANLQTSGPTVSPIIQYEEGPDKGQIIGYAAENSLTVRANVDQAGKVFDEGIAAGANQSSSMSFGLADESASRKAVLALAVQAAQDEARILAKAASVRLGGPRSVETAGAGGRLIVNREAKGSSTPVFPGTITVSAQVNVVYEYLYKGTPHEQNS